MCNTFMININAQTKSILNSNSAWANLYCGIGSSYIIGSAGTDYNKIEGDTIIEDFLFTENFAKGSNNIAISNGSLYIIGKGYKQVSELGYMNKPFVVGFDQIAVIDESLVLLQSSEAQ